MQIFDDPRRLRLSGMAAAGADVRPQLQLLMLAEALAAPPTHRALDLSAETAVLCTAASEAVRRRPYSVVLLDEVEKAHPETFDILLQVLDDGRLTDGQGRTVDFRNVILVMTSNLGSQYLIDPAMTPDGKREAVMAAVRHAFKPEFLNRLDETVIFEPLSMAELSRIVDLQVAALSRRLEDRRITLEVTDAARDWLARTGYDPAYGARPLRRLVQREIGDRLATALLSGRVRDGQTATAYLDASGTGLTLERPEHEGPVSEVTFTSVATDDDLADEGAAHDADELRELTDGE